jgi:Zn-finger nucleic acid-binding protein
VPCRGQCCARRLLRTSGSFVKCPRDATTLSHEPFGIKAVVRCGKCTGAFVPPRTVNELYGLARISSHRHAQADANQRKTHLPCPVDGRHMMQVRYKGIEIDVCPDCHGIWLGGDEVARILKNENAPRDNVLELRRKMENLDTNLESVQGTSNIDLGDLGAVGDTLRFLDDAAGAIADALGSISP